MLEIWKPIKGYEGLYEISNTGYIKTLGNFPKLRNKVFGIRKLGSSRGYLYVSLTDNFGNCKTLSVHRLVANNFLENSKGLRCVNHKDENKGNNHVDNLEWCSDQYNKEYSNKLKFKMTAPSGEVFITNNVSRFCRENNLLQGNISKVIAGTRAHHRGWKAEKITSF